jgi:hypothetical protein
MSARSDAPAAAAAPPTDAVAVSVAAAAEAVATFAAASPAFSSNALLADPSDESEFEVDALVDASVSGGRDLTESLPDEMLLAVFELVALLDPKAMMTVVHAVCRRWRAVCGDTPGVRLDFAPWVLPRCSELTDAVLASLACRF